MTDPTPNSPAPAPGATKSPLDVLEEILGKAGSGVTADDQAKATQTVEAQKTEAAQAANQEAYEAELKVQQAKDQAEIQQKTQELSTIAQTPAYQARVKQDQLDQQADDEHEDALEGYEIRQIDHTTIQVPDGEAP